MYALIECCNVPILKLVFVKNNKKTKQMKGEEDINEKTYSSEEITEINANIVNNKKKNSCVFSFRFECSNSDMMFKSEKKK